jgi:transketolase
MSQGTIPSMDMRDSFITALYDLAVADRRIVVLSNDFGAPALDRFRADLPRQFINAAISEQNLISTAAGLAKEGKRVIAYSIATFITLRALEQVKIDLCSMNLPVVILAVGAGYAYSVDGPTHHATEDISIMRALSNMRIISPSDSVGAAAAAALVQSTTGPVYIRLDRGKWRSLRNQDFDFSAGAFVVRPGAHLAIVATGSMVHRALEVAGALGARGIGARVVDLYRLKPLEGDVFREAFRGVAGVVTIEEHSRHGGLGGLVAEAMADAGIVKPLRRFAVADDLLYGYGLRDRLHAERGLDCDCLQAEIGQWYGRISNGAG